MKAFDIKSASGAGSRRISIGLVNNMPPAACSATERQFRQILAEAGSEQEVNLHCFSTFSRDASNGLAAIEPIFETELDGIIVTGAEPQSSSLPAEPIWPLITRLVDWGEEQALPVVWSCLAAHAAILHLDGIDRVRLDCKISGLFGGEVVAPDHPLLQGLADGWSVPHSRCNDLPEETLEANGYRVLVRSPGAGVDVFQKVDTAGFVFLQSHPEYATDSLWREFHRDVRRFVAGERRDPPALPQSYFGSVSGSIPDFPCDCASVGHENADLILAWLSRCCVQPVRAPWRPTAVTFFRNWLRGVAARKACGGHQAAELAGHAVEKHDLRHSGLVSC